MNHVIGLSHRVAYATAVALVGFLLAVMPAGAKVPGLARLLDLPVAAAGLLLPVTWRGVDLWFRPWEFHPYSSDHFVVGMLQHLRIAIPVYVLLFYVPNLFSGLRRWMRSRRGADQPQPASGSEPQRASAG